MRSEYVFAAGLVVAQRVGTFVLGAATLVGTYCLLAYFGSFVADFAGLKQFASLHLYNATLGLFSFFSLTMVAHIGYLLSVGVGRGVLAAVFGATTESNCDS